MKTILITFLFLLIGNVLMAQNSMIDSLSINLTPKAKLLYETNKGLVYALPQDNIPCLVSRGNSNMPIASSEVPGYISNPLLKKGQDPVKIIPLKNSSFPYQKKLNFPKTQISQLFPDKNNH